MNHCSSFPNQSMTTMRVELPARRCSAVAQIDVNGALPYLFTGPIDRTAEVCCANATLPDMSN